MSWAKLFKGDALENLSQPDKAAEQYRAILHWAAEHPDAFVGQNVVERAQTRLDRLGAR